MYLITTLTLDKKILYFKVEKYTIIEGHVEFLDSFGLKKSFPTETTTIEELGK